MPGTTGREGPPQQGVSPLARAGQEPDGGRGQAQKAPITQPLRAAIRGSTPGIQCRSGPAGRGTLR